VGGSLDHRRLFSGLRYRALTIGTRAKLDLSSSFTLAKFQQMRGKFSGGVGLNNERVALFASFSDILQHISTDSSVITVEKYGPLATVAAPDDEDDDLAEDEDLAGEDADLAASLSDAADVLTNPDATDAERAEAIAALTAAAEALAARGDG